MNEHERSSFSRGELMYPHATSTSTAPHRTARHCRPFVAGGDGGLWDGLRRKQEDRNAGGTTAVTLELTLPSAVVGFDTTHRSSAVVGGTLETFWWLCSTLMNVSCFYTIVRPQCIMLLRSVGQAVERSFLLSQTGSRFFPSPMPRRPWRVCIASDGVVLADGVKNCRASITPTPTIARISADLFRRAAVFFL